MATILIEGDPGAIRWLWAELDERNYLSSEFTVIEIEWNALPAPDLLATCKNLLNWSYRRYHGISVMAWQCTLCDGLSPDSGEPETIVHAKGCPVPQVAAAIAKAEPKEIAPDAYPTAPVTDTASAPRQGE